jgi:hypothetical protein
MVVFILFGSSRMSARSENGDAGSGVDGAAAKDVGGLPGSIQLPRELHTRVETMLQRSPTFRAQCRQLAAAPALYVRVVLDPHIDGEYRARSTISRLHSGAIVAMIFIGRSNDPTEWLGHEFEHVIEQIDGLRLPELARRQKRVWRSAPGMFETERAMLVGRKILEETRGASRIVTHIPAPPFETARGDH